MYVRWIKTTIGYLAGIFAISTATLSAATYQTLYLTPGIVPGYPEFAIPTSNTPGVSFVNSNSQATTTSFVISGTGITSANNNMSFLGAPGPANLISQRGSQVPGLASGFVLSGSMSSISVSDSGNFVGAGTLAANAGAGITTANDTMSFYGVPGGTQILLREGAAAPGLSGLNLAPINPSNPLTITNTGKIYQSTAVVDATSGVFNSNVLFTGTNPTDLSPIFRTGSTNAPDLPADTVLFNIAKVVAKGDRLLVSGAHTPASTPDSIDNQTLVVWATNNAGQSKIAIRPNDFVGGSAALVDAGTQVASFDEMSINKSGNVLIWGAKLKVDGIHASATNDNTLLLGSADSQFQVIAREGTPAPGLPGVNYGSSFSEARQSENGQIALYTTLAGTGVVTANDSAIFKGTAEAMQLLVREGNQAPGFPVGAALTIPNGNAFSLADNGSFYLLTTVTGGGTTSANNEGLFFQNPVSGQLDLLLKRGDYFEVAPGDFRIIADLSTNFSSNELSQLSFSAVFTDTTRGTFLVSMAVPEPAAYLASFAVIGAFYVVRRRAKNSYANQEVV